MPIWLWQSIVSGLATTLSAAGLLWLLNYLRNHALEKKITNAIQKKADSHGGLEDDLKTYLNAGIVVYNPFDFPFIVRSIWAEIKHHNGSSRIPLEYAYREYQEDVMPSRDSRVKSIYDFVTIDAFTNGVWILKAEHAGQDNVHQIAVHVEYTTFFRNPKVVKVPVDNSRILRMFNEMIDEINQKEPKKAV